MHSTCRSLFLAVLAFPVSFLWSQEADSPTLALAVIDDTLDVSALKTREASASLVDGEAGEKGLEIVFKASDRFPDVGFAPLGVGWDLSKYGGVRAAVTNTGSVAAKVALRVDNEGTPQEKRWNTGGLEIPPGETRQIEVFFGQSKGREPAYPLDPSKVVALHFFALKPKQETVVVMRTLEAFGQPSVKSAAVEGAKPDSSGRPVPANAKPSDPLLFGFDRSDVLSQIKGLDSTFRVADNALKVEFGASKPYPNVTFQPPEGNWNLSAFTRVEFEITNDSDESIQLLARVDNPGASSRTNSNGGKISLDPGETGALTVNLDRYFAEEIRAKLAGMRYSPWGKRGEFGSMIDPANIIQMNIYANKPARPHAFTVHSVRAAGEFDPKELVIPEPFFPVVDRYGQYNHQDWLNKVKTDGDLAKAKAEEQASIDQFPRPANWNAFGGWADGPQLEKTGHFYTTKRDGKWFLVDPDGRLFFSLGIDVVQVGQGGTPIDNRDGWFSESPWESAGFKEFVSVAKDVKHGDYKGTTPRVFNYYAANLKRKYGESWEETWRQLMPQRLMNWGFNTIANWSDPKILAQGKIPYTHWVFHFAKKLPWQPNTRNPIPDPFDPTFEDNIRKGAERMTRGTVEDPFCIGYFVDNELTWHDDTSQGKAALAGGPATAAKMELLKDLQAKYGDIAQLNAAWKTSFANWDAMKEDKTVPQTREGLEDLRVFSAKLARAYFSTVAKVLKEVAPNKLYLGSRFAEHNPQVVKIAAEYCDVVSFNIYRETIANWKPPVAIDKPVVIGEFHFGATDRGIFGPGLVAAKSTQDRAEKFLNYVTGAARNPQIVGTHWFALVDQSTIGRSSDGENYNIGFLSITDTPYKEMIDASRKAAGEIYQIRSK